MRVSYRELSKYVDLSGLTPEQVASRLTFSGTEVEGLEKIASGTNLVIGHIISCVDHPDSDHLHILQVNLGEKYGVKQIVCGAPNARKGLKVIVANVGAKLIGGEIKAGVIRGVESNGMCCSLSELGVEKKYLSDYQLAGIEELDDDAPIGEEDVLDYLGLDDTILDIKVLANRPDLLSIYNVALEVGALFGRDVDIPVYTDEDKEKSDYSIEIATDACSQFSLKEIRGIKNGQSPKWMQQALMAMGVRSINALVDIGNYVMLLTGQPLHMYDGDKLNSKHFIIKDDMNGKFTALDDKEYDLIAGDIVITNNGEVNCLGGVMGAKRCEATIDTTNIVIESASFKGVNVRHTSTRLGLSSESSTRFVKGTNHFQANEVLSFAAALIKKYLGGIGYQIQEVQNEHKENKIVKTTLSAINNRLGTSFALDEVVQVLKALHFGVTNEDEHLDIVVPLFRLDVTNSADIAEEVIRYLGYDNVKSKLPTLNQTVGKLSGHLEKVDILENFLVSHGLDECLTYTLINDKNKDEFSYLLKGDAYKILNPLSEDRQTVRKCILPSLLETVSYNFARQNKNLALFEISDVISLEDRSYSLAIALANDREIQHLLQTQKYDFYDMKGIVEEIMDMFGINEGRYILEKNDKGVIKELHPGKSALIKIGRDIIGYFGELHPTYQAEKGLNKNSIVVLEMKLNALFALKVSDKKMSPISKFPSVVRDFAFIVKKKVIVKDIIKEIKMSTKGLISDVSIFDIYMGEHLAEDEKSIALKVTYTSFDMTLNDKIIREAEEKIISIMKLKFGASLRG